MLLAHVCNTHGFREQGDLANALDEHASAILDKTSSVGNDFCTWVHFTHRGFTVRTSVYKKVVLNCEAYEILYTFGGHLAAKCRLP
jgi:hypothetical protein